MASTSTKSKSLDKEFIEQDVNIKSEIPKFKLEVGKHYQGSFWINEFGEIQVKPQQKGTNPGGMSKITEGDDWIIYGSTNYIRAVVTIPRYDKERMKDIFRKAALSLMKQFSLRDFRK